MSYISRATAAGMTDEDMQRKRSKPSVCPFYLLSSLGRASVGFNVERAEELSSQVVTTSTLSLQVDSAERKPLPLHVSSPTS